MIEEEQRKMQESILSLLHRKERERQEKMNDSVPEKSQLEKDIEQISIDKEVEKKVREDLGQNEHEKKRIQVPICNYGPSCKCNPVLPDDIFDQLEAGQEPGVKVETSSKPEQTGKETPSLETESKLVKDNGEPKRRKKRKNYRTAFEYNLKVDFHDVNSNFYQLLSSEDEDDEPATGEATEDSSEESYIEMKDTLKEQEVQQHDENSEEECENSFISEMSDEKIPCNDESLDEKECEQSELNDSVLISDESIHIATQNSDKKDVMIVEDIVDFIPEDFDTSSENVNTDQDVTRIDSNQIINEIKTSDCEEAYVGETESRQAESKTGLQSKDEVDEDIKLNDQNQEPLGLILIPETEEIDDKAKGNNILSLSIPVSTDKEEKDLPPKDLDSKMCKNGMISNEEINEQEEDDTYFLMLNQKISNSPREIYQQNTSKIEREDNGEEIKPPEGQRIFIEKRQSRAKRRKMRRESANLKLSSKTVNYDTGGDKMAMYGISRAKPLQDFDEEIKVKVKFPRSNCRDIMGLLQKESSADLNLYPDWKKSEIETHPKSPDNLGHEKSQPLPPISLAVRAKANDTENVIRAPDWTRVTVTDINPR